MSWQFFLAYFLIKKSMQALFLYYVYKKSKNALTKDGEDVATAAVVLAEPA